MSAGSRALSCPLHGLPQLFAPHKDRFSLTNADTPLMFLNIAFTPTPAGLWRVSSPTRGPHAAHAMALRERPPAGTEPLRGVPRCASRGGRELFVIAETSPPLVPVLRSRATAEDGGGVKTNSPPLVGGVRGGGSKSPPVNETYRHLTSSAKQVAPCAANLS